MAYQPPASDGGSPITGYHVERRIVGSTRWAKINKEPLPDLTTKVTDLVDGNEYEFRVAAENKAGIGPFSEPSKPFIAKDPWDKPGKPGRPDVSDVTGSTMALAWTAPESDGGAEITHYYIQLRVQGSPKWEDYNNKEKVADLGHVVQGLKEDTYYEYRVAAENKAGVGPWSDPSEPVKTIIGKFFSFAFICYSLQIEKVLL